MADTTDRPETTGTEPAKETPRLILPRRRFLTGTSVAAGGLAAFTAMAPAIHRRAKAQSSGPVKLGFIEDHSGNLSVYGIQKLHAAQLAVKEINEGKTLKGGPIGTGGLAAPTSDPSRRTTTGSARPTPPTSPGDAPWCAPQFDRCPTANAPAWCFATSRASPRPRPPTRSTCRSGP